MKSSSLVLALSLCGSLQLSHAQADDHARAVAPSNTPISALARLSSLHTSSSQDLTTPDVQDFRTTQGTRVLFVAASELPMVDIRITFDAGSARDIEIGEGLFGLSSLTSQLLFEATSQQTPDQIANTFESLGARYSASAYRDMFTVDLRSLSDPAYLNPALDQWLLALRDAQFPQSSIDRIMQSAAIGQKQRKDSPSAMGNIRFWRELYGKHAYAEPTTGTEASLRKIQPTHIRQFAQQYLTARNANIAITGQLSQAQAAAIAERISSSLPLGQPARPITPPAALSNARTIHVPFEASQSHVLIGQVAVDRSIPEADLSALMVGNEIFGGGGFNARLMKELREKRGLTYGAYSSVRPMRSQGPFSISYSTRADQAAESIDIAKQTLRDFVQQGIDQATLDEAKMGMLNSYPLSLASNSSINGFLGMMGFYDLPDSYLADYPKRIEAVTQADIQRVFRQYIQPDRLLTVIVGAAPSTAKPAIQTDAVSTSTAP
ncbi:MAG: pitrilysin family protein [Pseudomonadota bacterium]|nr:pitrilysin family protein [Pseudomonadota bacterium]